MYGISDRHNKTDRTDIRYNSFFLLTGVGTLPAWLEGPILLYLGVRQASQHHPHHLEMLVTSRCISGDREKLSF